MQEAFFRNQDTRTAVACHINDEPVNSAVDDPQTYPERNLNGDCAKIGAYFVGHSSVSLNTCLVSYRPPMSDHAMSDLWSLTSLSDSGTKSTWAAVKSAAVNFT